MKRRSLRRVNGRFAVLVLAVVGVVIGSAACGDAPVETGPYDLTPDHADGMTWRETIHVNSSRMGLGVWKASAKLGRTAEGVRTIDYTGISLGSGLRKEVEDGRLHCPVDERGLLGQALDSKGFRNAWLAIPIYLEELSLLGYVPPSGEVAVGDAWSSGDVVPFGLRTFELQAQDVEGSVRLERVAQEAEGRVADLLWTGAARIGKRGRDTIPITWTRTIRFDVARRRVLRYDGKVEVAEPERPLTNTVVRVFEYDD